MNAATATQLDGQVGAFRTRPLDSAHYTFLWMDALVIKSREHGRIVNVHALVAVGVNAEGGREVLGLEVASDEDGAGFLAFQGDGMRVTIGTPEENDKFLSVVL